MIATKQTTRIGAFWMEVDDLKLLQTLVKSHGLTHRDLAAAAGYKSHAYIGRLLRGEVKTLEPTPAARIAHYFDVDLADLFVPRSTKVSGHGDQKRKGKAA